MLVARAPLKLAMLPAGLGLGALLWLLAVGSNPPAEIEDLQARLAAAEVRMHARPETPEAPGPVAQGRPLFDLSSSGASADPSLALQGLALGATGRSALIAIAGSTPVWLAVGETRSGVTLRRVDSNSALVETLSGDHSLTLGASAAVPPPSTGGATAWSSPSTDGR